jgi:hypothetical protein
LCARITKVRYFTVTTMVSDQKMSESTPKTFACDGSRWWPCRHSRSVYSGEVPMSP